MKPEYEVKKISDDEFHLISKFEDSQTINVVGKKRFKETYEAVLEQKNGLLENLKKINKGIKEEPAEVDERVKEWLVIAEKAKLQVDFEKLKSQRENILSQLELIELQLKDMSNALPELKRN